MSRRLRRCVSSAPARRCRAERRADPCRPLHAAGIAARPSGHSARDTAPAREWRAASPPHDEGHRTRDARRMQWRRDPCVRLRMDA